jgi:hypothetical protein
MGGGGSCPGGKSGTFCTKKQSPRTLSVANVIWPAQEFGVGGVDDSGGGAA